MSLRETVNSVVAKSIGLFWICTMAPFILYKIARNPVKMLTKKVRESRPACLNDPIWGTHGYLRVRNMRFHYVAKGSEDKPLMLFVHGFPEFWYSWRHQIKEFANDYRVVAIDNRGYGETDKPNNVCDYRLGEMVEDTKEVIKGLGYSTCTLVAHDWGGVIACACTSKYPEMVDKLIVMNGPSTRGFNKFLKKSPSQLLKSWYMFVFQLPWFPEWLIQLGDFQMFNDTFKPVLKTEYLNEEDIEAYRYTFSQPRALTCAINYYRASFSYPKPSRDLTKPITETPVLILWGDKDKALDKRIAACMAEDITNCQIQYIEGSSHWVQQERAKEVNEYIRAFVSS